MPRTYSTDIPAGLFVPTQIPLDVKAYFADLVTISDLGPDENLAYTYYDGLVAYVVENRSRYEWRQEAFEGEVPLMEEGFTYPNLHIVMGVDYSLKTYNWYVKVDALDIENVGIGTNIYDGFVSLTKKHQFRSLEINNLGSGIPLLNSIALGVDPLNDKTVYFTLPTLKSNTMDLIVNLDGSINIEMISILGIQQYIVNSDYEDDDELGTITQPFKSYQKALDAYVGNGATNKAPENTGAIIRIIKDINTFVGSSAYQGLNVIVHKGATLVSNPTVGRFCDLDVEATLPTNPEYTMTPFTNIEPVDISFTIEKGGAIQLQEGSFKNRGTTFNSGNNLGKIIRIFGDASGIYKTAEPSVVSPSTEPIFSLNADNQAGFFNDGNVANLLISGTVHALNSQIAYIGLNAKMYANDCVFQFGEGATPYNVNTIPIEINGGYFNGDDITINNALNMEKIVSLKNGAVFYAVNSKLGDSGVCIFSNDDPGATTTCQLVLDQCINSSTTSDAFIVNNMPSDVFEVRLTNCNINEWGVDDTKVRLIPASLNTLGGQVVETLPVYSSRANAVIAGLFKGCKFINSNGLPVGTPAPSWFIDIIV